jgi:hypothetical protein
MVANRAVLALMRSLPLRSAHPNAEKVRDVISSDVMDCLAWCSTIVIFAIPEYFCIFDLSSFVVRCSFGVACYVC